MASKFSTKASRGGHRNGPRLDSETRYERVLQKDHDQHHSSVGMSGSMARAHSSQEPGA